ALPARVVLLRAASRDAGADARPYAVVAARRFSRAALALVLVLLTSGVVIAAAQVGSVGALLGTRYGRLLMVKLALVLVALTAATLARRRVLPALGGDAATIGRPSMRRLGRTVLVEAVCALAILVVVTLLGVAPPGRHEAPDWPLSFRLALGALADAPDAWPLVLVGSQIAILGVVAVLCSLCLRAARTLSAPPPDLRAHHTALHTAGDLYWWITHGRRAMPAFGHLEPEQRWSLVNYLRALGAAQAARRLGAVVESARPSIVAPDFAFAVGPTAPRALRDYRGARIVLVVVYTLPASRPRLAELAARYETLSPLGVEIIAVPADGWPGATKRLGAESRIFFPVVTDGAPEIVRTYGLFMPGAHAEFLIDRQGYL